MPLHRLSDAGEFLTVRRFPPRAVQKKPRDKQIYIGAPACYALEMACQQVAAAFKDEENFGGLYVVGSVLERPDWRDVDVRFIMADEQFSREFPSAGKISEGRWEFDPKWLLLTTTISAFLSSASGLPVDFQFQPQSHANERHRGLRNAIGLRF
jgi:hypothetical protein